MSEILNLQGRVALVTGAGQGVGRRIATMLAEHNAGAVVVNDFYADRAAAVAAEIEATGMKALPVSADVSDYKAVSAMFDEAEAAFGPVTILVNNAGNAGTAQIDTARPPFWETKPEDWAPWFGVNAFGVMHCCHAAVPGMIKAGGGGRIVTISSESGRLGVGGYDAYAASKAAALGFTRSLARTVGEHNITVNAIALATVATEASRHYISDPKFIEERLKQFVIKRAGEVDDIAAMTLFLASPAASWITGQTLPVNGGFSFNL